ncbi:hypothetical protein, partial [Dorea sp. YH-dor228]|uniref:hypothetical protein n=1 Tax=Dorea sp. YH-dor228 TaxID=3151120 RepID=UPI003242663F
DNFSIQQSFRIWSVTKFSHGIAVLFSVTDSSAWINGYRPTDPTPLRLTFPITEQTHLVGIPSVKRNGERCFYTIHHYFNGRFS